VTPSEPKPWRAIFRLLERDERVFAVLLAVAMVGGMATLGLAPPLRPRYQFPLAQVVFWFSAYKVGVFALVTVWPRATRPIFLGALAIDLGLVFLLLYWTGGVESLYYLLFFPLVAVNAYYFGPTVGLGAAIVAGLLYFVSATLVPPWPGWRPDWKPLVIVSALVGLPAFALGLVAVRERRARAEVERLNAELTGTLSRLQAAQQQVLEAERMATLGRLSLKVAHEVRNPIAAIQLNAEILEDIVTRGSSHEPGEAGGLVASIRDQVKTLDALTEEYLTFARFPRPHFDEESVNDLVDELADFVRPVATRQGLTLRVDLDPDVPMTEIDRGLVRQAVLNLVKNGLEALSRGGELTLATRRAGEAVEITVSDTGGGIPESVAQHLFEPFFTTKPQGTGLGLSIARQIIEEHGGEVRWANDPGRGAAFTIRLPVKRPVHA
jgi:signal transduction histidine kinase